MNTLLILNIEFIFCIGWFSLQIILFHRFNKSDYKHLNDDTILPMPKFMKVLPIEFYNLTKQNEYKKNRFLVTLYFFFMIAFILGIVVPFLFDVLLN